MAKIFFLIQRKSKGQNGGKFNVFPWTEEKERSFSGSGYILRKTIWGGGGAETLAQVIHQSLFFMFLSNFHFFESHERWHTGKCSEQRLYLHKVKLFRTTLVICNHFRVSWFCFGSKDHFQTFSVINVHTKISKFSFMELYNCLLTSFGAIGMSY